MTKMSKKKISGVVLLLIQFCRKCKRRLFGQHFGFCFSVKFKIFSVFYKFSFQLKIYWRRRYLARNWWSLLKQESNPERLPYEARMLPARHELIYVWATTLTYLTQLPCWQIETELAASALIDLFENCFKTRKGVAWAFLDKRGRLMQRGIQQS